MKRRHLALGLALLATLAAVFWTEPQESPDEDVVSAVRTPRVAERARPQAGEEGRAARMDAGERLARARSNLFPRQTWVPPPPPPKPEVLPPPPPPQAPPLPFKYLGRWVDGGKETVFLLQGDIPVPAEVGKVLPGSWRVDEVSTSRVVFTYLPLNLQSNLGITP